MSNNNLSDTWVLVQCGNEKFALNYKYINNMEDFSQAQCLKATTITGIKRGIYNILDMDIIVLDGRKIVGEKSIETIKLNHSAEMDELKTELLQWTEDLEWAIISNKPVETDYTKFKLYSWIKAGSDNKEISMIQKRMEIPYRELFIMADDALENRHNIDRGTRYSINISEAIKDNLDKFILKNLSRATLAFNKSINESCIIIKHHNKNYGLVVDTIIAVTDKVSITPKYSEYKVIAGDCKYKSENYNIFNVKYLTDLADRFGA